MSGSNIIYYKGGCNHCKEEKILLVARIKQKEDYQAIVHFIKEQGGEILLDAFDPVQSIHHNYSWRCLKGHLTKESTSQINARMQKTSHWCRECEEEVRELYREQMQFKKAKKLAKKNGVTFHPEHSSAKENRYHFRCDKGHPKVMKKHTINFMGRSDQDYICQECIADNRADEAQQLIKQLYGKNAQFLDPYISSTHRHSWSCGVKGHSPFEAKMIDLQRNSKSSGCEECHKKKNKRVGLSTIITQAQQLNDRFCKVPGRVTLLSDEGIDSRASLLWRCSNKEHQPFVRSYDNMRRRERWCPDCEGGKRHYSQCHVKLQRKRGVTDETITL